MSFRKTTRQIIQSAHYQSIFTPPFWEGEHSGKH